MTTSTDGNYSSLMSSSIRTTQSYQAQQQATAQASNNQTLGQDAFLKLFTTQLQNQDPTDPVKNEAFVAQLAQFTQVESLQNMQQSMNNLVTAMSSDRLLGAASLMGKTVAVPNGPVTVTDTTVSQGTINLPAGANGIQIQVLDGTGSVVRTMTMGPQTPGDVTINWDGKDDAGNNVANGSSYRYSVMANVNGKSTNPTVNTYAAVTGVSSTGTSDGGYLLQVQGGQTVNLANVTKVGY